MLFVQFCLLSAVYLCVGNGARLPKPTVIAPIPRGKANSWSLNSYIGQGIQSIFREIKTSFCSDLEALILQVLLYYA